MDISILYEIAGGLGTSCDGGGGNGNFGLAGAIAIDLMSVLFAFSKNDAFDTRRACGTHPCTPVL